MEKIPEDVMKQARDLWFSCAEEPGEVTVARAILAERGKLKAERKELRKFIRDWERWESSLADPNCHRDHVYLRRARKILRHSRTTIGGQHE